MRYIADLHIHSMYSRATSKASHIPGLAAWAAVKGIQVIGTGDFTHPAWFAHLQEHLEEAEPGLYRLRQDVRSVDPGGILPGGMQLPDTSRVRFVLSAEISLIYKRDGRVRKVHNVIFAPDFASVKRLNNRLAGIGNLEADGRPILGLDSRDLLEIVLETVPDGVLVPAHIWTPWFSLFGSRSGFDDIKECFGDLTPHVFALETGLSSDPDMNRRISGLDRYTLISNSDCHSPQKLGREANLFDTGFSYPEMMAAIRRPQDESGKQVFAATIEFYPEEGKYHCDGHRKCGVCLEPAQSVEHGGTCPVCGRPLTIGVLYRVMELADRPEAVYPPGSPAVHSLIPLPEILSELLGTGPATKRVMTAYAGLINRFGSEFEILLQLPIKDIADHGSPMLAEAIDRVRKGDVIRQPGFDGQFGVIRVFSPQERDRLAGQLQLFGVSPVRKRKKKELNPPAFSEKDPVRNDRDQTQQIANREQDAAINSTARRIIVTAGPGTGKTYTLVQRVIQRLRSEPDSVHTVITFTNKAADEVRDRIRVAIGRGDGARVATFHGFCLHWLRRFRPQLQVAGPELRRLVLRRLFPDLSTSLLCRRATRIGVLLGHHSSPRPAWFASYTEYLTENRLVDIDGVVPAMLELLGNTDIRDQVVRHTGHLFVDEFQDCNETQYLLVRELAGGCPVFVIGDPDQAIYGFRGADPCWFFRFIDELTPEQYHLFQNYRSGEIIVRAAARVIANNRRSSTGQPVVCHRKAEARIYLHQADNESTEARFVVDRIQDLLGGTSHRVIDGLQHNQLFVDNELSGLEAGLGDIAVLYRTGRQAEALAKACAEASIPVQVVDIEPYYCKGDLRILYLWIILAAGRADSGHLFDLLRREDGVGRQTLASLEGALPCSGPIPVRDLVNFLASGVEPGADRRLSSFLSQVRRMQDLWNQGDLEPLLSELIDRYRLDREEDDMVRFFQLAATFGQDLDGFARHLQDYSTSQVYDPGAEAVSLMTIHAAKGLEFPVVFLVGLEEELLPLCRRQPAGQDCVESTDGGDEVAHLEEERRLFYVGMTRSSRLLFLSHCRTRMVHGQRLLCTRSRFIDEIGPDLLEETTHATLRPRRRKKSPRQLPLF
ncbi:UvrD-helicase domain-containing protein [Desulfolithobacter sp.]